MERTPSMAGEEDPDEGPAVLSPCVEVPMRKGEVARKKLSEVGVLRKDLAIVRDGERLLIPILEGAAVPPSVMADGGRVTEAWFHPLERPPSSYKDVIVGVPASLFPLLPTAFDMIGHVAIVKLKPELEPYSREIGEALLKANGSVRTVLRDRGVKGPYRLRDVALIAGDADTVVTYREHGAMFRFDVAKVYFSPRLATERDRVAGLVRKGEHVLDMFAGVGPFSILIARREPGCGVTAVEKNPDAFAFLEENVRSNGTRNVRPVLGDAAEVAGDMARNGDLMDRVIMNLPHDALLFLGHAVEVLKDGGVVHFHEITEDAALTEKRALETITRSGRRGTAAGHRVVRNYAPGIAHVVLDVVVHS